MYFYFLTALCRISCWSLAIELTLPLPSGDYRRCLAESTGPTKASSSASFNAAPPQTVPTLQSRDEAVSESVYLSDHASPPASARTSGPGSSRMGRWIKAANRPNTTAAHHISV